MADCISAFMSVSLRRETYTKAMEHVYTYGGIYMSCEVSLTITAVSSKGFKELYLNKMISIKLYLKHTQIFKLQSSTHCFISHFIPVNRQTGLVGSKKAQTVFI